MSDYSQPLLLKLHSSSSGSEISTVVSMWDAATYKNIEKIKIILNSYNTFCSATVVFNQVPYDPKSSKFLFHSSLICSDCENCSYTILSSDDTKCQKTCRDLCLFVTYALVSFFCLTDAWAWCYLSVMYSTVSRASHCLNIVYLSAYVCRTPVFIYINYSIYWTTNTGIKGASKVHFLVFSLSPFFKCQIFISAS